MKVAVVDDEQLAVEVLEIMLKRIEGVKVEATFTNPKVAIKEIDKLEVDAVFLDMEMGTLHGLQLAKALKEKQPHVEIIFVTAYPEFAVDAFEVKAFDYLLKPVNRARLEKTMKELQEKCGVYTEGKQSNESKRKQPLVKVMGNFNLLDSDNTEVKWRTRKVKELFIYLWHHSPNPVHRSRIMEDLWAEYPEDRAATLMHTSLYQLRKTIKEIGFDNPVTLINEQYILNMQIESDFSEIEQIMRVGKVNRLKIETVIKLYKGNYLEEDNYHWALSKQQEMKVTFLAYIEAYVLAEIEGEELSHFIEICLEKLIELDPYNERFVYLLVDYYGKTKNLQKMVAAVEKFKEMWIEELGVDIPDEIYEVYNEHMRYI